MQFCPQAAILTGGGDRPYALGLATSLTAAGVAIDFIASDLLESQELRGNPLVRFLNLRGDMRSDVPLVRKVVRVLRFYWRLLLYAATAKPRVFHVLWNNKLELFDRTLLLLYYRMLGKRVVLTVHNVNIAKRDGNDGCFNRITLRFQYRHVDHLFVHTEKMKAELQQDFDLPAEKISVIPFGINSTVPVTSLTRSEARVRLGVGAADRTLLFFGNIAPYKGLEHLVGALARVASTYPDCRLIIAGRPKGSEAYWARVEQEISAAGLGERVVARIEYVPDEDTEVYFKAADALVLPYLHVFQSGVLFLAYNFGLPVIASDVGSLKDDIIEGETGYVCPPGDSGALAAAIERYFASDLYRALDARRLEIRRFAGERYSWEEVARITGTVYEHVSRRCEGQAN